MSNEKKIRESLESKYGTLSDPMSYEEFLSLLDSLDKEKNEENSNQ